MAITTDHNSWKLSQTNGVLALFGVPFFLVGCAFVGVILFGNGKTNGRAMEMEVRLLVSLFPMIFVCVGAGLMGYFRRLTVNARTNTFTKQWGFFFIPFSTKTIRLNDESRIFLNKETRTTRTKNGTRTYVVYPVRLGIDGSNEIITEVKNLLKARQMAEGLAKFIGASMSDSSRGSTIVRAPDELDMSVAERMAKEGVVIERPEPPRSMAGRITTVARDGHTFTQLQFPSLARRYLPVTLGVVAVLSIVVAYLGYKLFVGMGSGSGHSRLPFLLFESVIPVLIFFGATKYILRAIVTTRVLISEDMVHVAFSYLGIPRRIIIDAQEIEEIDCGDRSLDLITDRMYLRTLWLQKEHEVRFCNDMLKYTFQQRYHEEF